MTDDDRPKPNLFILLSHPDYRSSRCGPRRDLAIGPLLQFDDNSAHDRKHDQAREHLLGLHDLPGADQQIAHAALARAADHLGGDDQDDGDAHAEMQAGKNAGNRRGDHHLELDLPAVRAEVLRRLHQPAVGLADARHRC